MTIPFWSIPEHIQISIAKKLNIFDFIKFYESSRESYEVSVKVKTRFTISFEHLWIDSEEETGLAFFYWKRNVRRDFCADLFVNSLIRLEIKKGYVRRSIWNYKQNFMCKSITNFVMATNSTISCLYVDALKCSPKKFNRLLEECKTTGLRFSFLESLQFIIIPAVQKLHGLMWLDPVVDECLHHLKMPSLSLDDSNVTSLGVNLFLKEWMRGIRSIVKIYMKTYNHLDESAVFDGILFSSVELPDGKKGYLLEKEGSGQIAVHLSGDRLIIAPLTPDFFKLWPF